MDDSALSRATSSSTLATSSAGSFLLVALVNGLAGSELELTALLALAVDFTVVVFGVDPEAVFSGVVIGVVVSSGRGIGLLVERILPDQWQY